MVSARATSLLLFVPTCALALRKRKAKANSSDLAKANSSDLQEDIPGVCSPWLVCKCMATSDDTQTQCSTDTCTFAPEAPSLCCPDGGKFCLSPRCKTVEDWGDCEWANWNGHEEAGWDAPGSGLTVDLPLKQGWGQQGMTVISDVDDTMKCSGGPPGGADRICLGTSKEKMYPGVGEFSLALARGLNESMFPRKITPLSARPSELKAFLRMKPGSMEDNTYRLAGEAVGIQSWGLDTENALYGSLFDLSDFVHIPGTKPTRFIKLAFRKYNNWKKMGDNWGGPVAFVGDNGQGDAVAAQMMLKRSAGITRDQEGPLRVSFIHDVTRKCTTTACREAWAKHGIFMFEHYAHAAGIAAEKGLISNRSCRTVCTSAPMLPCSCP